MGVIMMIMKLFSQDIHNPNTGTMGIAIEGSLNWYNHFKKHFSKKYQEP